MASIFHIDRGRLVELKEADFISEDLLQRLLADHPELLGIASREGGRLLLIGREQAVPDQESGSGRWSLDHLFVDRQGVPVLVEVKRASDTRARREVVAQMLDYAANGVAYWPVGEIIDTFERSSEALGEAPGDRLRAFLGDERDPETFWQQVESNLRSGRIRMVFVADRIAPELRRIVEFLNEQMRPAEVLAVEMPQYVGDGEVRTLVPSIVGRTERAQANKRATPELPEMSIEDWLERFEAVNGHPARKGLDRALAWMQNEAMEADLTRTQSAISIRFKVRGGDYAWPFYVRRASGRFEISLGNLEFRPEFKEDRVRQMLLDRIARLPGYVPTTEKLLGSPYFSTERFNDDAFFGAFRDLVSFIAAECHKTPAAGP